MNENNVFVNAALNSRTLCKLTFLGQNNLGKLEEFEKSGYKNFDKRALGRMLMFQDGLALSFINWGCGDTVFRGRSGFGFGFENKRFVLLLVNDPFSLDVKSVSCDEFGNDLAFGVTLLCVSPFFAAKTFGSREKVFELIKNHAFDEKIKDNLTVYDNKTFDKYFFSPLDGIRRKEETFLQRIERWKTARYLEEAIDYKLNDNFGNQLEKTEETYEKFGQIILARKIVLPKFAVYEKAGHDLIYTGFSFERLKELFSCSDFFKDYCKRKMRF